MWCCIGMDTRTLLKKAETSVMTPFMELAGGNTSAYGRDET